MEGRSPSFGSRARVYDTLRPQDAAWWRRFDVLVREGDLRGRRVIDVGCGTGALAAALAERAQARVWGIDPSAEMLAVARARVPRRVGLKQGRAESLPFATGWFERVLMSLVVHLVERPAAFGEARRVLSRGGLLAIASFHEEHFERYWAAPFFPSLAGVDRARFPAADALVAELEAAGFTGVRLVRTSDADVIDRDTALERLRGRHISTFDLLDPAEVRAGIATAERELPDRVEVRLEQIVAVATR